MTASLLDMDLLHAFQQHDPAAEKQLFDRFFRPLCLYAHRTTGHLPAAEDIVAEAFEKCMARRAGFQTIEECKGFLFRVTRNASLNFAKAERVHRAAHQRIGYLHRQDTSETEPFDTEQLRAELLQDIYAEIEHLPGRCKDIFKLLFFEHLSTEEIGQRLGINPQTVRSQKHRAIGLLRIQLLKKGKFLASLLLLTLLRP